MSWWELGRWDWPTIAKSAVGAGFGTAAMQGALAVYRDARHRKSHAAYMAMRLAVILEAYAAACSEFISRNDAAETPPDGELPLWDVTLPELPPYPDDTEGWRAIDRRHAGQCLNLRNKISGSQNLIGWTIEYTEDELGNQLDAQAAQLGLDAWTLAIKLRRQHGIESADVGWDYGSGLKVTLERAKASMETSRTRNAESMRRLFKQIQPPP